MLFKFGFYWKFLLIVVGFWLFYALFGFETTTITILSAILALFLKERHHIV